MVVPPQKLEMSSTIAASRPFVVLLGWLGCQPKNLRRYEALYHGFEILSEIATPAQVIRATLAQTGLSPIQSPPTWPNDSNNNLLQAKTIEDLAWEILAEMDESEAPVFFLHIFSNGGGFVWEALLRILADSHQYPGPVRQRLCSLEQRIAGVIVDSAPSLDFHCLPDALSWLSFQDRMSLLWQTEPSWLYHWWWRWGTPPSEKFLHQRKRAFIQTWTKNPVAVRLPMLFLYSQNDPLSSAEGIRSIVQNLPNSQAICWQVSIHCGHLVRHPDEYQAAVHRFVKTHLKRPSNPIRSNL